MIREVIQAVRRAVEADCIVTGGFSLTPHCLRQIEYAYQRRGLIIFTDPDTAGEMIRRRLSRRFPRAKHAFIPREQAMADNDIGVERASAAAIRSALARVRSREWQPAAVFSRADIMNAGLSGTRDAAAKRAAVGERLGIGYANAKQFLHRLNTYGVTRTEFAAAVAAMSAPE